MEKSRLLHGSSPHKVYDLLLERYEKKYAAGSLSDGNKLGLVVEGGGMRGIISSAALHALHYLGFHRCIDAIYGTSAGAIGGAYFLSGTPSLAIAIYCENLIGRKFVNLWRLKNILDIKYLFDNYVTGTRPIDCDKVINSSTKLFISTTKVRTGEVVWFGSFECDEVKLIKALTASSSTPLFTSNMEDIDGELYNDGMIQAGIPIKKAIQDGCTHVIAVLTRSHGYQKKNTPIIYLLENLILFMRRYSYTYRRSFNSRIEIYNRNAKSLYKNNEVHSFVIAPSKDDYVISNSETREPFLRRAAEESIASVASLFDVPPGEIPLL